MTRLRVINYHMRLVIISFVSYFLFDYCVFKTAFLNIYPFVGLKSFLPMILGLNFGVYGIAGEIIAIIIKALLENIPYEFILMELIIVVVIGIGAWFLWHIESYTHRIHFSYVLNFVRYISIVTLLSLICGVISVKLINNLAFEEIVSWNITMSILVGIPIEIIYGSLMNMDPILPPVKVRGKRIEIYNDIIYTIDSNPNSIAKLNAMLEELLSRKSVDFKKSIEIQNIVEELYLRIKTKYPNIVIDVKLNYDENFSSEFIYIERKYNPFHFYRGEDALDLAGLKIIKHRALLASYSYNFGLNIVRVVV